jgi:hypothetical protein
MKRPVSYLFLLLLLTVCAGGASAQGFTVVGKNLPAISDADAFTSVDGGFSIALPKQISAYEPRSTDTPAGHVELVTYRWRMAEALFTVVRTDRPEKDLEATGQRYIDVFRDNLMNRMQSKAKLLSETNISLAGHPGRELRLEFSDGFIIARIYLVGNRLYQALAAYPTANKAQEPKLVKVLDSFKLLSQAEVEAELKRKLAEATPSPLPQEPVAKRQGTDAEDEGLKGKVKTVFSEDEDLSGTWSVRKRKATFMSYYDKHGNLVREERYDYRGNPAEITLYGYLDGERVSVSKYLDYEYNPPAIAIASPPGEPQPRRDTRYSTKYTYKYEHGRLIEKDWYNNAGQLFSRSIYKYTGNQKEILGYDDKGTLDRKDLYTLDDKGNVLEEITYNAKDDSIRSKYSYSYEFDAKGNWTRRTVSKWVTKDGKSSYQPAWVDYRTITYY